MEPTGISIGKESWALLREEPLYSARFIDREGTNELVVVVRVEMLDWFLDVQPPLTLDLVSWRSPRGVWVSVLSYELRPNFGASRGGAFYLNPLVHAEAELLRKLVQQEALPVIFLSEDCESHYTSRVLVDPQLLQLWQQQVKEIQSGLRGRSLVDGDDPAFTAAVQELLEQA
jgi:hypothetical protein